jgi:hypothetical protein
MSKPERKLSYPLMIDAPTVEIVETMAVDIEKNVVNSIDMADTESK